MNITRFQSASKQLFPRNPSGSVRLLQTSTRLSSQDKTKEAPTDQKTDDKDKTIPEKKKKKTAAELDEELRAAMEGHAGDGGLAGAELEGGVAVSMKRGVRTNMFRYI